jgi:hypothetical protein
MIAEVRLHLCRRAMLAVALGGKVTTTADWPVGSYAPPPSWRRHEMTGSSTAIEWPSRSAQEGLCGSAPLASSRSGWSGTEGARQAPAGATSDDVLPRSCIALSSHTHLERVMSHGGLRGCSENVWTTRGMSAGGGGATVHAAKILLQVFFVIDPRHCSAWFPLRFSADLTSYRFSSLLLPLLIVVPTFPHTRYQHLFRFRQTSPALRLPAKHRRPSYCTIFPRPLAVQAAIALHFGVS